MLQVQLEVGADPREVGRARGWVRSRLDALGMGTDESLAETLVLLVSELVTNAVVHTGRPAVLRVLLSGCLATGRGTVRIEVVDASGSPPRRRPTHDEATGGRGLALVAGLADRWGWRQEGAGKRIWCELDRDRDATAADRDTTDATAPADTGHPPGAGGGADRTVSADTTDAGKTVAAGTLLADTYDSTRAQPIRA